MTYSPKSISTYFISILLLVFSAFTLAQDKIVNLTATPIIGLKQSPTVYIDVNVDKTRDLYVSVQKMSVWKTVKRTMKRIKRSGNYHFNLPISNLEAGKYRIDVYLAPKGKNWADRLTEPKFFEFQVVNQDKYVKKVQFSDEDKIKYVDWPKKIIGNQSALLTIKYAITEPRDLHIKLLDSQNWKPYGSMKFPVKEPGDFKLPLSDLLSDFPAGKYAWVVYLTAKNSANEVSEKYGKHFVLMAENN